MSGTIASLLPEGDFAQHDPNTLTKSLMYFAVSAGRFKTEKDFAWNNQLTFGVAATYLEEGEGTLVANDKIYRVEAGDFFLFDSSEEYSFDGKGKIMWIHMDGRNIHEFCRALKQANGSVYRLTGDNPIPFLMKAIFRELKSPKPRDGIIGANIASMLCVLYDKSCHVARGDNEDDDPVQKAVIYIRQHLKEKMTSKQIAGAICISTSHLSKLFRDKIGQSLHDYVIHAKIDTAKTILKTTSKTVGEIAIELGYANDSNFVNAFKKVTGFTPAAFRNNPY